MLLQILTAYKINSTEGSNKLIKKLVEPKTGKLAKSQKLYKSKKLSKSRNSPKFRAIEVGPSFLISDAKMVFNYLWLAFTKAPIF